MESNTHIANAEPRLRCPWCRLLPLLPHTTPQRALLRALTNCAAEAACACPRPLLTSPSKTIQPYQQATARCALCCMAFPRTARRTRQEVGVGGAAALHPFGFPRVRCPRVRARTATATHTLLLFDRYRSPTEALLAVTLLEHSRCHGERRLCGAEPDQKPVPCPFLAVGRC